MARWWSFSAKPNKPPKPPKDKEPIMANNFNIAGLIVLDTTGAGDVLAAGAPVKIQAIMWDCGALGATGDRVVLTDSAGNSIFESTIITSVSSAPAYVE